MTKEMILEYLRNRKESFEKQFDVSKIGLFGSYANGRMHEDSDIDLFVEMKQDMYKLVGLKNQIEEELHKKVDIVTKHKYLKPILLEMIEKEVVYV